MPGRMLGRFQERFRRNILQPSCLLCGFRTQLLVRTSPEEYTWLKPKHEGSFLGYLPPFCRSKYQLRLNTGKSKDETQREAKHEENKSFNELILNIFTGILAIATASLAIITGFLVRYTKKLWGATSKLVDGANNAEAAYILPHITRHSGFFEGPPLFPRPRIQYGFRNHGKTLAVIRRWRDVTTDMLAPNPIFKQPWETRQVHYIPVIGDELAGEVWTQIPDGMTAEKALQFLDAGRWLYIIGEVEYEDVFGIVRVQGYCLRIMKIAPDGWRIWRDGGLAYNNRRTVN